MFSASKVFLLEKRLENLKFDRSKFYLSKFAKILLFRIHKTNFPHSQKILFYIAISRLYRKK